MKRRTSVDTLTEQTPLLIPPDHEISSQASTAAGGSPIDPHGPNQSVGGQRAVFIILSLWVLIFLQAANMSGITTAQSSIAHDLDASGEDAIWFTSSYLIAMASLAPLMGRLSQVFSPRSCIMVSAVLFSIGGLVTGKAANFSVFIAGRVVSGIGGAGILTLSLILVLELTGQKRRGLFIGLVNAGYTIGVSLGAVIAGGLLSITGWRPLFWGQSPIAILAGMGVFLSLPSHFTSGGPQDGMKQSLGYKLARVDYSGAVLLTSSIVLFLLGLTSPQIQYLPLLISAILLLLFVFNEIYLAREPVIPIALLKSRGVLLTCVAQLGFMSVRWTVLFYTPVYAMAVRNWSPATAGSILIPTNAGFGIGGLLAGWLHIRRAGSFYLSCIISFFLFSVSIALLAFLSTATSPAWLYIATTTFVGLFTGAALNYTLAHLLHLTAPSTHFIASSLIATFRGFAGSFGSSIGGGLFVRVLRKSLEEGFEERGLKREGLIRKLMGSPAMVGGLTGVEGEVAREGYVKGLQTVWVVGAVVAVVMVVVQAGTGWTEAVEEEEGE